LCQQETFRSIIKPDLLLGPTGKAKRLGCKPAAWMPVLLIIREKGQILETS